MLLCKVHKFVINVFYKDTNNTTNVWADGLDPGFIGSSLPKVHHFFGGPRGKNLLKLFKFRSSKVCYPVFWRIIVVHPMLLKQQHIKNYNGVWTQESFRPTIQSISFLFLTEQVTAFKAKVRLISIMFLLFHVNLFLKEN